MSKQIKELTIIEILERLDEDLARVEANRRAHVYIQETIKGYKVLLKEADGKG